MPISELGCCGPRDQAGQWSGLEYLGDGECVAFGGDPELGRPRHGPVATALLASLRCSLAVVSEVFCGGSRPSDSRCAMAARFHAVALLHRPLQPLDGQSRICGGLAFAWMVYERQEAQGRMAPRIGCPSRGHSMGGHRRGGCRHLWIQIPPINGTCNGCGNEVGGRTGCCISVVVVRSIGFCTRSVHRGGGVGHPFGIRSLGCRLRDPR